MTRAKSRGRQINRKCRSQKAGPSCFDCWYMKRSCDRGPLTGCCARCQRELCGTNHGPSKNAPSFEDSGAFDCLQNLIVSTPMLSPYVGQADDLIATMSIVTNQFKDQTQTTSIKIDQPFYPSSESLTRNMDQMVENSLGLDIKSKDDVTQLVRQASSAGAYLALLFPTESILTGSEVSTASPKMVDDSIENNLKRHVVKFGTIRFDQLSGSILRRLRQPQTATSSREREYSLNTIAAAGILYCQLDHVKQGFHKLNGKLRLLCDDSKLQEALKSWLCQLQDELLWRLRKTCGKFPAWAERLRKPVEDARRHFDMIKISMSLGYQLKTSDSQNSIIAMPDLWSNAASDSSFPSTGQLTPEGLSSSSALESEASPLSKRNVLPESKPGRLLAPKEGPPLAWDSGHTHHMVGTVSKANFTPWKGDYSQPDIAESEAIQFNWDSLYGMAMEDVEFPFPAMDEVQTALQLTQLHEHHDFFHQQEEEYILKSAAINLPWSQLIDWDMSDNTLRGLNAEPLFTAEPQTE